MKNCEIDGLRYSIAARHNVGHRRSIASAMNKQASKPTTTPPTQPVQINLPSGKVLSWTRVAAINVGESPDVERPFGAGNTTIRQLEEEIAKGITEGISKGLTLTENQIENVQNQRGEDAAVIALRGEVERLTKENHQKDGELRIFRELYYASQKEAQCARDKQLQAEQKFEVMNQSLVGRALLGMVA